MQILHLFFLLCPICIVAYKIFLEKENEYSKKYLGYQRFDLLNNAVEGYLLYKSIILRMTLLQMTDNEIESLKK